MNKEYPLISIVIPTYNSEKFLKECFDSVLNQTYPNLEVIIVDGGSTDSTISIIKAYLSNPNWFLFESKKGVSKQRNIGLDKYKGDYIFFLDSDDYINNDFIKNLYKTLIKNNLDFVTPRIIHETYNDNNEIVKTFEWQPIILGRVNKDNFFSEGYNSFLGGPTKLYKRETIKNHKFLEKLSNGEDLLFNYDIVCENEITYNVSNDSIYYYRHTLQYKNFAEKRMNRPGLLFYRIFPAIIKQLQPNSKNYFGAINVLKIGTDAIIKAYVSHHRIVPVIMYPAQRTMYKVTQNNKKYYYLFPHTFKFLIKVFKKKITV